MATKNYREIQKEYLRRTIFPGKRLFREYHTAEPIAEMLKRLSKPLENGCHEWLGKIGTHGYAYCAYRVGRERFHRKAATVAYELKNGLVPDRLEVSHLCGNPRCVNPDHLVAETHSENLKRRRSFSRYKGNVCKRGHLLPPSGERNKNGSCPICYAEYQANWKAKNKQYEVDYYEANKDRINAQRRARRARNKELKNGSAKPLI